jgi:hypothetical protein
MGSQDSTHGSQHGSHRGTQYISIREYARRRGVSEAAVRKWIRADRLPVHPEGIDPVEADAAIAANRSGSQVSRIADAAPAENSQPSMDAAPQLPLESSQQERTEDKQPTRARAEADLAAVKAERARLALRRDLGEVVLVADVEQALGEVIETSKNLLLLIPETLADRLAASRDAMECRNMLEHEIRLALEAIALKLAS